MRFSLKENQADYGLCGTCDNAFIAKFEDGSVHIKCEWNSKLRLTKKITSCTAYMEKNKPNLRAMKEAAWLIDIDPKRRVGFKWLKPRADGRSELLDPIEHIEQEKY